MKMSIGLRGIVILSAIVILLMPGIAAAYIDPGTGSYILQMVMGGVLAGLFAIKIYWNKIITAFRKKPPEEKKDESGTQPD